MSKYFRFALMAATVCGLSLVATSCKDDTNNIDNGGQPTAEEQAAEDANTFWSVAANLVSPSDVTADYLSQTFEPTIGVADEGSSTVRVVTVPDVEAAALHFAAIVDADVNESTTSYTYQNDAVGTLTYTKSSDGKSLAKVDVSIRQIPHLQQIVYKTVEQMGANSVSDGVPFYSFGDVVKRTRKQDGVTEYWMCVQAPFTKQGSTDAVWASVSKLPDKNLWSYKASNDFSYLLPTQLGNNKEYMKDLAEMLYAMVKPEQWEQNMSSGDDMKAFNLVKKANTKYINQYFWKRVMKGWTDNELSQTIFADDITTMVERMIEKDENDYHGLKLLYRGYSWWTWTSNNLTLYESTITVGTDKEANARHLTWKEVTRDVIKNEIVVNCLTDLWDDVKWIDGDFFDSKQPRYIFRFATTTELAGTKKITAFDSMNKINDIQDVYVYTSKYRITPGSLQKMDDNIVGENGYIENNTPITETPKRGSWIAASGDIFDSRAECENFGGAVAFIIAVHGQIRTEKGYNYNGLAIGLKPTEAVQWAAAGGNCKSVANFTDISKAVYDYTGYHNTSRLYKGSCGNDHQHAAAQACHNYDVKMSNRNGAISEWFLPSFGQLKTIISNVSDVIDNNVEPKLDSLLTKAGLADLFNEENGEYYWTSTPYDENTAWVIFPGKKFKTASKTESYRCLPFVAFKYKTGGATDPEPIDDDDLFEDEENENENEDEKDNDEDEDEDE